MNKKELRQYTIRIIILGVLLGLIFGVIIGAIIMSKNKTCENLKEDYDWLKESSIDCWNRLRILDTHCWSFTDCIENPELEGCKKEDCNYLCCGEYGCDTSLMMCFNCNFSSCLIKIIIKIFC